MIKDSSLVVFNEIVCKWGTIKSFVAVNEVSYAGAVDVKNYYAAQLR